MSAEGFAAISLAVTPLAIPPEVPSLACSRAVVASYPPPPGIPKFDIATVGAAPPGSGCTGITGGVVSGWIGGGGNAGSGL